MSGRHAAPKHWAVTGTLIAGYVMVVAGLLLAGVWLSRVVGLS